MRPIALFLLTSCVLSSAACTTAPGGTAPTASPSGASAASGPEMTFATDRDPRAFGEPCKRDVDPIHCGTKERVSVVITMRTPFEPKPLAPPPCRYIELDPQHMHPEGGRGCVNGERLYLAASCTMCRQTSEWGLVALVEEMTDAQLVVAQRHVGLAPEPLLRSTADWHAALTSASAAALRTPPGLTQPQP